MRDMSIGRNALMKFVHQVRFACAFAEALEQNDVKIRSDLVEANGARTAISKVTSKTKHLKRTRRFPVKKDTPQQKKKGAKQPSKAVSHGRPSGDLCPECKEISRETTAIERSC